MADLLKSNAENRRIMLHDVHRVDPSTLLHILKSECEHVIGLYKEVPVKENQSFMQEQAYALFVGSRSVLGSGSSSVCREHARCIGCAVHQHAEEVRVCT